jgi:hypothetical protein
MLPKKPLTQDYILPLRRAILSCGFQRQHNLTANYYNYVDRTGRIEVWEEMGQPGIRIVLKETLNIRDELKNMGLYIRFPDFKPHPFYSSAMRPITMNHLTTPQFLVVTRMTPIARKLAKEIRKQLR